MKVSCHPDDWLRRDWFTAGPRIRGKHTPGRHRGSDRCSQRFGPAAFALAAGVSADLRTREAGYLAAILPGLSGGRRNALFSPRRSLATRVSCFRHGCRLRDRCPSCGQGLAPFSQKRLVPHQICALCGAALCTRTGPATAGVRHLERLIDDLLRLHAVGYRMAEGRSLPDLLGSACFQFGRRPMSIARLPHRDRYHLFRQLTEGRSTPFGSR